MKKTKIIYCLCTEQLKCADLIGSRKMNENKSEEIKWKNGFLLEAIEKGGVVILDDINQATIQLGKELKNYLMKNILT